MSELAKGVFFTGKHSVVLHEFPLEAKPGELKVRSLMSAISHGTEMLAYDGRLPDTSEGETLTALKGDYSYPLLYGYMNAGLLEDGSKVFAFRPHQDAFYALPDDLIYIPEHIELEDAVLIPSLETALSITHDTALRFREHAAVVGLGVIGLLAAELLLRAGAASVLAVDCLAERRELAQNLGCTVCAPGPEFSELVSDTTHGRGVDHAIHTSASPEGLQSCIDICAHEGQVVEASWYGRDEIPVRLGEVFHRKRIRITSSQVSHIRAELSSRWDKTRRMGALMELLPQVCPSKYISHRFPLTEAAQAFECIATNRKALQIVLTNKE
ncbi:MAG: zinc-binding alcohol dehydrogenase [Spirochaetaceae bacterium]|nr:MAG: zinc-binding alcohol dehydrogenase [Spirochaetaceae bacterium]